MTERTTTEPTFCAVTTSLTIATTPGRPNDGLAQQRKAGRTLVRGAGRDNSRDQAADPIRQPELHHQNDD